MSFSVDNNDKPVYDVMLFGQIDIYPRENYILIIDVSGTKYKFGYFNYDFKPLKGIVDPLHKQYLETGSCEIDYGNLNSMNPFTNPEIEMFCEKHPKICQLKWVGDFIDENSIFVCNNYSLIANSFEDGESLYCGARNYSFDINNKHVVTFNNYDNVIIMRRR